jgi:hypothetical protein
VTKSDRRRHQATKTAEACLRDGFLRPVLATQVGSARAGT